MRVLLDQSTPAPLRQFLKAHFVRTAAQQAWSALSDAQLLTVAEGAGFEVFVTPDKNLRYQQNLASRKIAIVEISNPQWPKLKPHVALVVRAVDRATPGSYQQVAIPNI